jgi:hypothetical protein
VHLWGRVLPSQHGGVEDVPEASLQQDAERLSQLQNLGEGRMRLLYLWAGKEKSGVAAFDQHQPIVSVGIDEEADLTICKDIADVTLEELEALGPFDFVWASPDCKVWSLANLHSGHWKKDKWAGTFIPQTPKAKGMIARVKHTLWLIENLKPTYWILENPFGILRHMDFMKKYPLAEVTYCRYGDKNRMKPTDLWGRFPRSFRPLRCSYGSRCHPSSPRGSSTGTQALDYDSKVRVPHDLSLAIAEAAVLSWPDSWFTLEDFI